LVVTSIVLAVSGVANAARGCRKILYGTPSVGQISFAIKVSRISCSKAGAILTYPVYGYDGTRAHGAQGLTGFRYRGFHCRSRVVYPGGKYYIAFRCRRRNQRIDFRWTNG
jgi:hypothetical protein